MESDRNLGLSGAFTVHDSQFADHRSSEFVAGVQESEFRIQNSGVRMPKAVIVVAELQWRRANREPLR